MQLFSLEVHRKHYTVHFNQSSANSTKPPLYFSVPGLAKCLTPHSKVFSKPFDYLMGPCACVFFSVFSVAHSQSLYVL